MLKGLPEQIFSREKFQAEFVELRLATLKKDLLGAKANVEEATAFRLLQAALHLAGSFERKHRIAAYKIGVSLTKLGGEVSTQLKDVLYLLFIRLANFPAVDLLYGEILENFRGSNLPGISWFELKSKEQKNTITLNRTTKLKLTDFQKNLWDALGTNNSIAFSAPTSAGKSFVLQYFLANFFLNKTAALGAYIVPTRALMNQITAKLGEILREFGLVDVAVVNAPLTPTELGVDSVLYVLTQERMQVLLETEPTLVFSILVSDEAQSIGDGARGIILQTVLEKIFSNSNEMKALFGSPFAKNPEIFGQIIHDPMMEVVHERESPVTQNLVFVDHHIPARGKRSLRLSVELEGTTAVLGEVGVPNNGPSHVALLSKASWEIGKRDKNLIYCNGQAACEAVATALVAYAEVESNYIPGSNEKVLKEFSDFLKEHVHPEYSLGKVIELGIGYHYGFMPSIVRKTVEELFVDGHLSYLVCTSTLMQGVNLPAKNLFLLNPRKGHKKIQALTSMDFWNLAGRAGRLGKEFEGNVFLINHKEWDIDPLQGEREEEIKPSFAQTIKMQGEEIIKLIESKGVATLDDDQGAIESTFVKLFNHFRKGDLEKILKEHLGNVLIKDRLYLAFSDLAKKIDVPIDVTEKNINISIFKQQKLLDFFREEIRRSEIRRLIPQHPQKAEYEAITAIFGFMEKILGGDESQRHRFFSMLALRWMRGESLAILIKSDIEWRKQNGQKDINVDSVIRELLRTIETEVRFKYVKFSRCYIALLVVALEESNNEHLVESIPSLALYLELGASTKTMINLIGIGLSRTTAGIVAARMPGTELERKDILDWFRAGNIQKIKINRFGEKELRGLGLI